ncbi:hypothetical protein [uncultured Shewanella sp.]|uniref:hypothetical protein n=1 Tax=uncultured Shewanella sp. TaxID=173975 RepID=UPI002613A4BB|nr:hypothetical protein [uncultured Shewanella sp.]
MSNAITWNNQVKDYFTQMEVGCMRNIGLNLASYDDVKNNADSILNRVKRQPTESGFMPKGGKRWVDSQINNFEQWITDGCPEN